MKQAQRFKNKKLIIFDLDGTLTETKSDMDPEMAGLITLLLEKKLVAIIGGGRYEQFIRQFIKKLRVPAAHLKNLFLFPTTATSFYRYQMLGRQAGRWKNVYVRELSKRERSMIKTAFEKSFKEIHYVKPRKTYGAVIEDRGTQVTFSALGQDVVKILGARGIALKKKWTRGHTDTKIKLAKTLQKHLPNLDVKAAGFTSIDITKKGIDKEYGIYQIEKYLHIPIRDMVFVGDALFPGGNDYAARRSGVECVAVKGPRDTKRFIRFLFENRTRTAR